MRLNAKASLIIIGICFVLTSYKSAQTHYSSNKTINPLQFGLNEAKTGEERYYVLYRTHKEAQRLGVGVTYEGIKEIDIVIPDKAKSIPITQFTDFAGVTLQVENKKKNIYLFSLSSVLKPVAITGKEIDSRDFSKNPVLKSGSKILVVTDDTPWVEKRKGHDYGATRKDIMFVKDGKSESNPVQSYCTSISSPNGCYRDVDESMKIVIKNIKFNRTNTSTEKTNLFKVENQYNVELSNVVINTPEDSGLVGDKAICFLNCLNIRISDVSINGTYSLPNYFGYGISLNNVYDLSVTKLYARANWGVFGNNNVNKAHLTNCDINRFDIHCYGKDIMFENCNFVDLYNQFSSVYGLISFKNCVFSNFTPILMDSSYNAYTAFDISFEKCKFNFDKKHYSIVSLSGFVREKNPRLELKEKSLPNVTMISCCINASEGVDRCYVFNTKTVKNYEGYFSHVSKVVIKDLSTNDESLELVVFSNDVKTLSTVELELDLKQ